MTGAWNRIDNANKLMSAAMVQGIRLDKQAATIILGYLEGHDYCLMEDEQGGTLRHDEQYGDDHRGDEIYTVLDAIDFCQEMNENLLNDYESLDSADKEYLSQFEADRRTMGEIVMDSTPHTSRIT